MVKKKRIQKIQPKLAYEKSLAFLHTCSKKEGFLASVTEKYNYRRIWGRDGVIIGISSLMSGDKKLINVFKSNLETLAKYQGKHGQIPSNVSLGEEVRVSYGMTYGRVDATLLFIIGCGQYIKATNDTAFLKKNLPSITRAMNIAEAWEYNQKGFIFVPPTGDWADEMPRSGYILYDQILYFGAVSEYGSLLKLLHKDNHYWHEKAQRLKARITTNFWPNTKTTHKSSIYHPEMFLQTYSNPKEKQKYWKEAFPSIFNGKFDAFANILALLFDLSTKEQAESVIRFFSKILGAKYLVPAFYPVVHARERKKWAQMQCSYSFTFKNKPYHFHNGGLWPMLTGFYIAALVKYGKKSLARKYLDTLNYANSIGGDGSHWGFYEYHHGQKKTPEGTSGVAWSAAGGVIGYASIHGKKIFL